MTDEIWEDLLSKQDKRAIEKAGYDEKGAALGDSPEIGDSTLAIDVQELTVGLQEPILDAIETLGTATGKVAYEDNDVVDVAGHGTQVDRPA